MFSLSPCLQERQKIKSTKRKEHKTRFGCIYLKSLKNSKENVVEILEY